MNVRTLTVHTAKYTLTDDKGRIVTLGIEYTKEGEVEFALYINNYISIRKKKW